MATRDMAVYCFDTLIAKLENRSQPSCPHSIPNHKFPLFITWKKGSQHRLRGCIGTFSDIKLHGGLAEYALISALRDSRFDPVTLREVPDLTCAVSLLVNFEDAGNYKDWVVGVHGIRIYYNDGHRTRDAVYLPEVASEQGWNHQETLDNLIQKGGYRGSIDENFRKNVKVVRFQSSKVLLSFHDYLALKN